MRRTTQLLALLAGLAPLAAAAPAQAQAPPAPALTVDTFFAADRGGIADTDFSPTNIVPDLAAAVAVDGDRIYTVGTTGGSSNQDIGIIALRPDGEFDTGFSGDGKLVIPIAPGTKSDVGRGIAVLPDGRLRVLAATDVSSSSVANFDVTIVGLNADGSPDSAFGTLVGGNQRVLFPTDTTASNDVPARIAVGHSGRIAVVGTRAVGSAEDTFVSLREADGGPVSGFGSAGVKFTSTPLVDHGVDIEFRPGGALVALVVADTDPAAANRFDYFVRAYTDTGEDDPAFGEGGARNLALGELDTLIGAEGGLIVHGGRLWAAGTTRAGGPTDGFVARVEADGSGLQHRSFDMRGRFVAPGIAATSHATDLVVVPGLPETLVVVGGVLYTPPSSSPIVDWAAAAFNNFDGDLAAAGYGDIVIPAPGNGRLLSAAAGADGWLAVAGEHIDDTVSDRYSFGNARLLIDAEKSCDLGVAVAEPAEVVFRGLAPASLTARVTNVGTRVCQGTLTVPAPYRMAPVVTGPIAPGATFTAASMPLAYDGPRRAEDLLPVRVSSAGDANPDNDTAAAHVVFSFCDLALAPVGRAGAIPTEGRRRFVVTLRNTGTTACRVRIGSKPTYSLPSGQSAADRVPARAPRGARPGTRVQVVLRAGATGDVNPANNAATVSPTVIGVGDSDVRRHGARGFSGIARNGTGAVDAKRLRPARVHVALMRKGGKSCSWLKSARGTFGRCGARRWVRAKGTRHWRLRLAQALPPGRYVLFSRTTIGAGFSEASFSAKDRNRVEFRIR